MSSVLNWIVARLKEPSTWAGIGAVAAAVGASVSSNSSLWAAAAAGLIAALTPEKSSS